VHVIYTSKGVIKMLGCALSIEKYGIWHLVFILSAQVLCVLTAIYATKVEYHIYVSTNISLSRCPNICSLPKIMALLTFHVSPIVAIQILCYYPKVGYVLLFQFSITFLPSSEVEREFLNKLQNRVPPDSGIIHVLFAVCINTFSKCCVGMRKKKENSQLQNRDM
jgi:hypothetical protein